MRKAVTFGAILAISLSSAADAQSGPPTFYALQRDNSSLQLLALDSVAGSGANTTALVIDLFRGQQKFGMMNTWKFNCPGRTMRIIKGAMFSPGHPATPKDIRGEVVTASSTPLSRRLFGLVCTGSGQLEKSQVYYEDLGTLIRGFWR